MTPKKPRRMRNPQQTKLTKETNMLRGRGER
jgi:hypothetical protein